MVDNYSTSIRYVGQEISVVRTERVSRKLGLASVIDTEHSHTSRCNGNLKEEHKKSVSFAKNELNSRRSLLQDYD